MSEGIICSFCQTINRADARFCSECGSILGSNESQPTQSLNPNPPNTVPQPTNPNGENVPSITIKSRPESKKLEQTAGFLPRPAGAIFADRYLLDQLIYTDESQHQYLVNPLIPIEQRYRCCPNPACRAIHPPNQDMHFCSDCGTRLTSESPSLVLVETPEPLYDNASDVANKSLVHGSVRPPLETFSERLGPQERFCTVQKLLHRPSEAIEAWQALDWGPGLAYGLDYLHTNGIHFDGKINTHSFALDNQRAVWADLSDCKLASTVSDKSRQADVRSLSGLLYHWLTGETKYKRDPRLPAGLNQVFERGLSSQTYPTAKDFGKALENAIQDMLAPQIVDYHSGRRTDLGLARSLNEDSLFVFESNRMIQSKSHPIGLYLVADGMGGHAAGEVASQIIADTFARKMIEELAQSQIDEQVDFNDERWLHEAVREANRKVLEMRKTSGTDLGSTVVAALLRANDLILAHVGDSRAYLVRSDRIEQLTTDHSLVERLIETGQITPEEARSHPQRNVIYRTIGDNANVEVDISTHKMSINDKLLLCSDGLSGMITDEKILEIIEISPSPQAACDALITAANATGGEDNITVILVELIAP